MVKGFKIDLNRKSDNVPKRKSNGNHQRERKPRPAKPKVVRDYQVMLDNSLKKPVAKAALEAGITRSQWIEEQLKKAIEKQQKPIT